MRFIKKAAKICTSVLCAASIISGTLPGIGIANNDCVAYAASNSDAVIDYDYYTNADYALVDTENLYDISAESDSPNYRNGVRSQKTNKIILNRIDSRHDANRTTGSVVIEKTTADDAHYDFNSLNSHDMGYFPYYYYEGRVRAVLLGAPIRPAFFRDTVTTGSTINTEPFSIDATGKVTTSTGKTVKTLTQNEWLDFKLVLDVENNSGRLYIDDALVDDDISLRGLKTVCMLRIWVDTDGTAAPCTAEFDKLKLLGMRHDYDPANPDFHPPFFSDDAGLIEWLSGGDKTAFYGYSQNVFANGQKHIRVDEPLYGKDYNHILYVSAKALSLGYDFSLSVQAAAKTASDGNLTVKAGSKTVTYNGADYELETECLWQNNTVYVPVESFAKTVLKHDVKSDVNGMVITSAAPFVLDTTEEVADYLIQVAGRSGYKNNVKPIKALNWFMSFERPTAATLKADFAAVTGDGAGGHPRLIGTKADFDYIRNNWQTDASLNEMVNDIIKKADSSLSASCPVYELPDGQRILDQARKVLEYFRNLGFAYQITGDEKYAVKVWEFLAGVLSYPDWNPSHMIDTAELVGGCAIGFDWCYDYFDELQKKWIYQKVYQLGMKPINDAAHDIITTRYEWAGANDYVASKSNFNTVINGSQLLGVTAFAEFDPDFCFDAMHDALRSMEYTMLVYRPDGIWMESPSYWEYSATYVSRGISSVINATGNHYGFMDAQGINSTSRWFVSQSSYAGINNFHDAAEGNYRPSALAFFGKLHNDKVISAIAEDYAVNKRTANVEDALWYVPDNTATIDELPLDLYYEGFDTVGSRSSYGDNCGFFYATHGGQVTCYHSQYDVCTFVMDLMGVRWAYDLGKDDYNVRRDQNGFNKMYRDIAEGHNVMVFNQSVPGQVTTGCAEMTKWHSEKGGSIAVYDVTSVYSDWVTNATRGFLVGDNRQSLTIRDEFTPNADMPAHWFMCTPAQVDIINNNYAILSKDGKQLKMEVLTNVEDYTLTVGAAQPLPTSPQIEGQNANEGYSRIAIELGLRANQNYYVMVKLSPYGEQTTDINYSNMPASEWTVDGLSTITDSSKVLTFDSFEQNTNYTDSDFKVNLRKDASLYPEFSYNKAMGVYGKAANDAAIQLTMTPDMTHGNTAETTSMATVSEVNKTTAADGEYYELQFDMLRAGSTNRYKEVRIVTDEWKGNPAYLLRIDTAGGVTSPYLGLTSAICIMNKNSWLNFKFVIKPDNSGKNTVSTLTGSAVDTALNEHDYWLYINGTLASSGKFRNNSRTDKDAVITANHFTGVKQLLFMNYTDAAQNTKYTNTNPPQLFADNISISTYGETLTHGIDFSGYTSTNTDDFKNEVKTNRGDWRGAINTSNFYDMYTQKGVFGRNDDDVSFVSTVTADEIDYNRIELAEPGYSASATDRADITAPKLNNGEFYELELHMAYTGTGTTTGVQGFYTNAAATDGKQYGYAVAIRQGTGNLTAFNHNYPDIVFEQGKWYKFNVVIHSGNDHATDDNYKNWYKIYVNDELVVDKTVFDVKSQRSGTEDYTRFMGFHKLWVGTVNDGTYNAEVPDRGYFDDISVTYCGTTEPTYTPVKLTTDNEFAKKYMGGDTTLESYIDARCADLSEFYATADNATIEYRSQYAAEGENPVIIHTAKGDKIFAKLIYKTDVAREIPFGSSYNNELIVGEKDFTKASYVAGAFGKSDTDYAIKMTTENIWNNYYIVSDSINPADSSKWVDKSYSASGVTTKTRDSMNPYLGVTTEGTGRNVSLNQNHLYSIGMSVLADGDYDSVNIQLIPSSDKYRVNVIKLMNDGRIMVRTMKDDGTWNGGSQYQQAGTYNKNEWHRVQLNVFPDTNKVEIVVDGNVIASQQLFSDTDIATGNAVLSRFKIEQSYNPDTTSANPKNGYFMVDDIDVTQGSAPYNPPIALSDNSGGEYINRFKGDNIIIANDLLDVADINSGSVFADGGNGTTYRAFDNNSFEASVDSVTTGNILVVQSGKIYDFYYIVNNKDGGNGTITEVTSQNNWAAGSNKVSFALEEAGKCVAVVAGYDASGSLVSINFADSKEDYVYSDGKLTQSADVVFDMTSDVQTVKAFVVDSFSRVKPVAKSKTVK